MLLCFNNLLAIGAEGSGCEVCRLETEAAVAASEFVSFCFNDFCFFTFCCPERPCDPGVPGVSVGVPAG